MLTYTISEADHCRRADSFLRNLLPGAPQAYLTKLFKTGHFHVNGEPAAPGRLLFHGDRASLKESGRTRALLAGRPLPIDILYGDGLILAINKPAGMPMHPAAEVDDLNLVEWGTRLLMEEGGGKLRPVNRLDRGTSGAVLLAVSPSAAGMFGRLVKEEGLDKIYLAVVGGVPEREGTIAAPLEGKEALTGYRVLCRGRDAALLALFPETGRMHQIRQHLRLIGHPVMGDRRYGGRPLAGYDGHLLHSFRTAFVHPVSGERTVICAPLPAGMLTTVRKLVGPDRDFLMKDLAELAAT